MLGVSTDTLRRWDRDGKLRTTRDERNRRRVPGRRGRTAAGLADPARDRRRLLRPQPLPGRGPLGRGRRGDGVGRDRGRSPPGHRGDHPRLGRGARPGAGREGDGDGEGDLGDGPGGRVRRARVEVFSPWRPRCSPRAIVAGCGGGGSSSDHRRRADRPPRGGTLIVLGASSLTEAVTKYGESFEGATSSRRSPAPTNSRRRSSRAPRPTSSPPPTPNTPQELFEEGLVEEPQVFAANELVIAVPEGSDIKSLADLTKPGVKLVIGDPSVPVGSYTRTVLGRLPAAERAAIKPTSSPKRPRSPRSSPSSNRGPPTPASSTSPTRRAPKDWNR